MPYPKRPPSQQGARKPQQPIPPKPKSPSTPVNKLPTKKELKIDYWEEGQGDGSAGTYRPKPVPGGPGTKRTYTPERD